MKIRDPHDLISRVDLDRFDSLKGMKASSGSNNTESSTMSVNYVEPSGPGKPIPKVSSSYQAPNVTDSPESNINKPEKPDSIVTGGNVLKGKIQRLGDYIDTDAVRTIPFMPRSHTQC